MSKGKLLTVLLERKNMTNTVSTLRTITNNK